MAGVQSGGSSQLQQGSITGDARKVTGKTLGGSGNDRKVDGGKIKNYKTPDQNMKGIQPGGSGQSKPGSITGGGKKASGGGKKATGGKPLEGNKKVGEGRSKTFQSLVRDVKNIQETVDRHTLFHLRDQRVKARMSLMLSGSGIPLETPTESLLEHVQRTIYNVSGITVHDYELSNYYRSGKYRKDICVEFLSGSPNSRREQILSKYDKSKAHELKTWINFRQSSLDFFLKRQCLQLLREEKVKHVFVSAKTSITAIICLDNTVKSVTCKDDLKNLSGGKRQKKASDHLPMKFRTLSINKD